VIAIIGMKTARSTCSAIGKNDATSNLLSRSVIERFEDFQATAPKFTIDCDERSQHAVNGLVAGRAIIDVIKLNTMKHATCQPAL
jgi:hypothetical protein